MRLVYLAHDEGTRETDIHLSKFNVLSFIYNKCIYLRCLRPLISLPFEILSNISFLAIAIAPFTLNFSWKITFLGIFMVIFGFLNITSKLYQIFMGTGHIFSSEIKFKGRHKVNNLMTRGVRQSPDD